MTNPKEYKNKVEKKSNRETCYARGNDYYSFGLAYEKFSSRYLGEKFI